MPDDIQIINGLEIKNNIVIGVVDKDITSVTIPDFVTSIGYEAFSDCSSLTKIIIPNSVTSIGGFAFSNCSLLTKIIIPDSVTSIGGFAFSNCSLLTKIIIPDSVTSIGGGAFGGCRSLKKVNIPNSVTYIGDAAFSDCSSLTKIIIPDSVTYIGDGAFFGCSSLTEINISSSVTSIGYEAFRGCSSLTKIIIPDSVTYIGDGAFRGCSLTEINIPSSVTSIGEFAFDGCRSLKKVNIPDSVTSIGDRAFRGCSLTEINIPSSVTSIGYEVFADCSSLTEINIPSSVTSIGHEAFSNCSSLTKINIPDSVTYIGPDAFSNCSSLTKINIPDSVTYIGDGAFFGCSSLTEINIPSSVTSIGDYAFRGCSLTEINIPSSVTSIGDGAFFGCSSLTEINIPSSVTSINANAFKDCDSLKTIKIHISNNNLIFKDLFIDSHFDTELEKTDDGFVLNLQKKTNDHTINTDKSKEINPALMHYYIEFFDDESKRAKLDQLSSQFSPSFSRYIHSKNNSALENNENFDYSKIFDYNVKSLNNLVSAIPNKNFEYNLEIGADFYKLCENIGILNSKPITISSVSKSGKEKIQQIDYAQKAREFLKDRILDGSFNPNDSHAMFDSMKSSGFKREFADFFLDKNNFTELMNEERNQSGFIARCYNEFEVVQAAHTSNRGSQRQLAPTVDFFKKYFATHKFTGVTEETLDIESTISPYFSRQEDFDNAVKIMQEKKDANVSDNIVGEDLKEDDVFERVDKLIEDVKSTSIDTLSTLTDLANKKFTWEILNKNDPINLVLGKLCSCCAHLEGAGNGIMRASIIHPDVQNIVIRDHRGVIVAKSTIYVNRQEGYAVCNNVEVNYNITEEDKLIIYKKYKEAINEFAEKYNEKYPNNPLKIINVGMHLNDLGDQIGKYDKASKKLYKALNYGEYAFGGSSYNGDSATSQYTIWENESLTSNNEYGV